MSKTVHWYRVEYIGAWDMERKVRVAYVHTPEAASLDEVKRALWQQHDLPVSFELFIHVLDCMPVERDYTPEEKKVVPYIGVKMVDAWPEERNGQPGYGVKYYPSGYISWCPKRPFEVAYFKMDPQMSNSELRERLAKSLSINTTNASEVWEVINKWAVQGLTNTR